MADTCPIQAVFGPDNILDCTHPRGHKSGHSWATPDEGETMYRIEFQVQRRRPGEEDFAEIGFGSSGGWDTPAMAAHMVGAAVEHFEWETQDGQPDPAEVKRDVEGL